MIVDSSEDSSLQAPALLLDSKCCIDPKLTMLYHFIVESSALNSAKLICAQPCQNETIKPVRFRYFSRIFMTFNGIPNANHLQQSLRVDRQRSIRSLAVFWCRAYSRQSVQ